MRSSCGAFSSGEYPARSIYEATFIYETGIPLLTVTGQAGSARFIFGDKDGMARRAAAEFQSDASACARSLFHALGQLKREADAALGKKGAPPTTMQDAMQSAGRQS